MRRRAIPVARVMVACRARCPSRCGAYRAPNATLALPHPTSRSPTGLQAKPRDLLSGQQNDRPAESMTLATPE